MKLADVILAGASVRSLAKSAIRDGLDPICVDMFADADLKRLLRDNASKVSGQPIPIASFEQLPEVLERFDPTIPLVLSGGIENHLPLLERLNKQRFVVGPSIEAMRLVRDPHWLFSTAGSSGTSSGCEVPVWYSADQLAAGCVLDNQKRWLLKDRCSSGGLSVNWLTASRSNAPVSLSDQSDVMNLYVQEHIEGVPVSATFFRSQRPASTGSTSSHAAVDPADDPVLLGAALQLSGLEGLNASGFQFCGNVGPVELSAALQNQALAAAVAVTRKCNLSGVFGIDFVARDGRLWLLELNPRITASHELHELSNLQLPSHLSLQLNRSADRLKTLFQVANGRKFDGGRKKNCRAIVYSDREIQVDRALDQALLSMTEANQSRIAETGVYLADVPSAGTTVKKHWTFCSIYFDLKIQEVGLELQKVVKRLPIAVPVLWEPFLLRIQDQIDDLQTEPKLANC